MKKDDCKRWCSTNSSPIQQCFQIILVKLTETFHPDTEKLRFPQTMYWEYVSDTLKSIGSNGSDVLKLLGDCPQLVIELVNCFHKFKTKHPIVHDEQSEHLSSLKKNISANEFLQWIKNCRASLTKKCTTLVANDWTRADIDKLDTLWKHITTVSQLLVIKIMPLDKESKLREFSRCQDELIKILFKKQEAQWSVIILLRFRHIALTLSYLFSYQFYTQGVIINNL